MSGSRRAAPSAGRAALGCGIAVSAIAAVPAIVSVSAIAAVLAIVAVSAIAALWPIIPVPTGSVSSPADGPVSSRVCGSAGRAGKGTGHGDIKPLPWGMTPEDFSGIHRMQNVRVYADVSELQIPAASAGSSRITNETLYCRTGLRTFLVSKSQAPSRTTLHIF